MKRFNNKIMQVRKHIDKHITEDLSLTVLAKRFGMNKYYLCHLFKENTGHTLLQYIKRKRLDLVQSYYESGMIHTK